MPEESEIIAALKLGCRKNVAMFESLIDHWLSRDDALATGLGALASQVDIGGLDQPARRRALLRLERKGLVLREPEHRRHGAHRWWPVGFLDELRAEGVAPARRDAT